MLLAVMAGRVPAIHAFTSCQKDVDAQHKAGHDGLIEMPSDADDHRNAQWAAFGKSRAGNLCPAGKAVADRTAASRDRGTFGDDRRGALAAQDSRAAIVALDL